MDRLTLIMRAWSSIAEFLVASDHDTRCGRRAAPCHQSPAGSGDGAKGGKVMPTLDRPLPKLLTSALAAVAAASLFCAAPAAAADGHKPVIALSNAYYGNTWRHQMVDAFVETAAAAKKAGLISDYIVLNG